MKQILPMLLWFYRRLLCLYPASFRHEYEAEMEELFRQLLEENGNQGFFAAMVLLLRELRDLPVSLFGAYNRQRQARRKAQAALSPDTSLVAWHAQVAPSATAPLPWRQAALAILPGLWMLQSIWHSHSDFGMWIGGFFLTLSLLFAAVQMRTVRSIPAWFYPFCGLAFYLLTLPPLLWVQATPWFLVLLIALACIGGCYAIYCLSALGNRVTPLRWMLVVGMLLASILFIALTFLFNTSYDRPTWWQTLWPAITIAQNTIAPPISWVALLFVPMILRHGLRAALILLGLGYVLWSGFTLDLNYAIAGSAWANLIMMIWTCMLLIVAPLWVLRARTQRQQAFGLTIPLLIALIAIVPLEAMARAAPHLLTDIFDIYRYIPHSDEWSVGIGVRPPNQFVPILLRTGTQAVTLYVNWLLIVFLYWGLARLRQISPPSISVVGGAKGA